MHWWQPGRDVARLGRDYTTKSTPIDAAASARSISGSDFSAPGTANAWVDFDGDLEMLGNTNVTRYGVGDVWSIALWVRPDAPAGSNPHYIVDLDASRTSRSESRIALELDTRNAFAVEVSDSAGRTRSLASLTPVASGQLGTRWYHVVAVKTGDDRLVLYVDGQLVAQTDVGVPIQGDVGRGLGIGARVIGGHAYSFEGAVHSIALWNTALRAGEVTEIRAGGSWSRDLTR